jgi:hypothetical protein
VSGLSDPFGVSGSAPLLEPRRARQPGLADAAERLLIQPRLATIFGPGMGSRQQAQASAYDQIRWRLRDPRPILVRIEGVSSRRCSSPSRRAVGNRAAADAKWIVHRRTHEVRALEANRCEVQCRARARQLRPGPIHHSKSSRRTPVAVSAQSVTSSVPASFTYPMGHLVSDGPFPYPRVPRR